ncbi:MAG: NAD(P)H-hydrate dehydratase [Salibacteraceae bacterium]
MIKILSANQLRKADEVTMEHEPISSIDLMERAADACFKWMVEHYTDDRSVFIFAGVGNNGGDALAIARKLLQAGWKVETFIVRYSERFSDDLQINLDRLKELGHEVNYILEEKHFPSISSESIIVDGIFGTGLNREAEGLAALCIDQINASIAEVVALDMPSGLFADELSKKDASAIYASITLSFQSPKLSFFLPGCETFVGKWEIIDIGLDANFIMTQEVDYLFVPSIASFAGYFKRSLFQHKGNFGHVLVIAGSLGKMGAAVLSTKAALRSGAGKVTAHVPHSGNSIMQISIPEAMTSIDGYDEFIGELPNLVDFNAIAIGPGLGTNKKTRSMLKQLLSGLEAPLVLDADALNLLADKSEWLKMLPKDSILTPHVGEFDRLFGKSDDAMQRLKNLRAAASKYQCIIVLKGAYTAIAFPNGKVYFNSTGNPGMATAGSGDVLTGIITAFLAQTGDPFTASLCAVFVHGVAGDLAALKMGVNAMIADDIIIHLGEAIKKHLEEA